MVVAKLTISFKSSRLPLGPERVASDDDAHGVHRGVQEHKLRTV